MSNPLCRDNHVKISPIHGRNGLNQFFYYFDFDYFMINVYNF